MSHFKIFSCSLSRTSEGRESRYTSVILVSECPSISEMLAIGIPKFLARVAKVCLNVYIRNFVANPTYESQLSDLGLLTKEECSLLSEVRKTKVREITIKFMLQKSNATTRREYMEISKPLKEEAESRLIEIFLKGEYAEIVYKQSDGNLINFRKNQP